MNHLQLDIPTIFSVDPAANGEGVLEILVTFKVVDGNIVYAGLKEEDMLIVSGPRGSIASRTRLVCERDVYPSWPAPNFERLP